jgi:hypothetical protein
VKLADLKRIKVGTKLRMLHSLMGPCDKARVVMAVTTVNIQFTGDGIAEGKHSYLPFPKARDFRADADGFTIMEGDVLCARYVYDHTKPSSIADQLGALCRAAAEEAFRRMCAPEGYGCAFFLYYKRAGMELKIAREDERPEGCELATPERIPRSLTVDQLSARFYALASKLPILIPNVTP